MSHDQFASEDRRRLNTWAGVIAQALRPDAPIALTPEGLRVGRKGSLAITAADGWFDHECGNGGRDAISLIRHLRGCTAAEAAAWAQDWLDRHPGERELSADGAAEAAAEASERRAAYARQILDEAVDPAGTAAAAYLESRGLTAPFPSCVKFLPDARTGEGALVGILTTATGEVMGAQLGFLDPDGRKSTVRPRRQLFFAEKSGQTAFRISVTESTEDAVPLVVVEGLEDALSIARAGAAREVIGVPGVGRFGNFDLPAGDEVVVFCDGDAADSEAARQLGEAVDRWVLAGARVRLTATPAGADANSVLQDKGPEELRRLVAEAAPAALSFDADVVRLAGLPPVEYERERQAAAKRHDVRVSFLDAAVKAARAEAEAAATEEGEDEALHPEPVADIGAMLDQALAELQRYVVAAERDLASTALWALHTHFTHHNTIWLPVSPKLAIQAPDRNCGKSTLLEAVGALVPRPNPSGPSIEKQRQFGAGYAQGHPAPAQKHPAPSAWQRQGPDAKASVPVCENAHAALKKSMKSKRWPGGPDGPDGLGSEERHMPPTNGGLGEEEVL